MMLCVRVLPNCSENGLKVATQHAGKKRALRPTECPASHGMSVGNLGQVMAADACKFSMLERKIEARDKVSKAFIKTLIQCKNSGSADALLGVV
jgi:hypothetical protein